MGIDARTKQILWGKAGATCAFPNCCRRLVKDATLEDKEVLVGEIAHIVAQSPGGPRNSSLIPGDKIDGYENLILLCHEHHEIVDQQFHTYTVERLLQFKKDHESWVHDRLSKDDAYDGLSKNTNIVEETVYATLLPVTKMPHYIYSGECTIPSKEVNDSIKRPTDKRLYLPFTIRGKQLYTFNNLKDYDSPYNLIVDPISAKQHNVDEWLNDPDQFRLYVELLNRVTNKITGRLGLMLDRRHQRYYFEPDEEGKEKHVVYQSVGGVKSERLVAWNPHFKHNDEPKKFWEHLAVSLNYHKLGDYSWGLAIRPERRFTTNGYDELESKLTGKKSTKRKSRMYNFDFLQEVQFWRDFLSQGQPRINCLFGKQALVIENKLINTNITWPKIDGDQANRMAASYEDDLFTLADLSELEKFDEFDCDIEEIDEYRKEGKQVEN